MRVYMLGAANPEAIRVIHAAEGAAPDVRYVGFLDNDPAKQGRNFYGLPVVGGIERVAELNGEGVGFVNLITGSTRTRWEMTDRITALGGRLANLIHPSVDCSMTTLGVGLYVQQGVILQAAVTLKDDVSIHAGTIVGHETQIGRSAFIAHAVSISGCCRIGDGTFIGTNATIFPRLTIGRWATIGAGTVVREDVPDGAVVVGNPGRILRIDPQGMR